MRIFEIRDQLQELVEVMSDMLRFNKMMSLVKRVTFTKWARGIFLAQSLFLDMSIIFYKLQDAICGWLVKLENYMDFYF